MDFTFEYEFDEENERWNVVLAGEIDIFNSARLRNDLKMLFDHKEANMFFDCAELEYIDSTALGALVGVMKKVKSAGCEMHLTNVKPNLMKLFRITHLDQVFIIEGGNGDA